MLDELLEKALRELTAQPKVQVGQWVNFLRKKLQMTQAQLARRSNVPQPYLSRVERGLIVPNQKTLEKLFEALQSTLFVLPLLNRPVGDILQEKIEKLTSSRIQRMLATFALEGIVPDSQEIELVRAEIIQKLKNEGSALLWEE